MAKPLPEKSVPRKRPFRGRPSQGQGQEKGTPLVTTGPARLQKRLAESGVCSRREGEKWILAGRVAVNGAVVTTLGTKVEPRDRITVDGDPITTDPNRRLVLAMNKPLGVLCTRKDPEGRTTVFDLLANAFPRLISVGRLDLASEGLLLFTNDGHLSHRLMHPSSQAARIYRVRVYGRINAGLVVRLRQGANLEDGPTGPVEIQLDRVPEGANSWLTITLREGRNRLVRRFFESFDMTVSRLIRIGYGGVTLGEIPQGQWRRLVSSEVNRLMRDHPAPTKILPPPHPKLR